MMIALGGDQVKPQDQLFASLFQVMFCSISFVVLQLHALSLVLLVRLYGFIARSLLKTMSLHLRDKAMTEYISPSSDPQLGFYLVVVRSSSYSCVVIEILVFSIQAFVSLFLGHVFIGFG